MNRRHFLNTTGFGIVTACIACQKKSAQPNSLSGQITIDVQKDLPTANTWVIQKGVIVVRRNTALMVSSFLAFQAECTHAANLLNWNANTQQFQCPLHGSIFSENGAVINGPANRALKSYTIQLNGQTLTINL